MLLRFAPIEISYRTTHTTQAVAKRRMFFNESRAPCLGGRTPLLPSMSGSIDPRLKTAWFARGDGSNMRFGSRDRFFILIDTND